jgi:peptidoglycan-N-acetylglucosamine deacetylase
MYAEVQHASRLLQEILGHPIGLYRPPHGQLRALDFIGICTLRQTIVLWNVDPRDLAQPSAEHITSWFEATHLDSGDLILLHDSCDHTVAALPSIISRVRRAGLGIERLDRWIQWRAGRSTPVAGPRPHLP